MKISKRIITICCLVIVCVGIIFRYNIVNSNVNANTNKEVIFKFNFTNKTIQLGSEKAFALTKRNIDNNLTVSWSSSNPEVATVNEKGRITPKKRGNTTIYASIQGTQYVSSYELTVLPGKMLFYSILDNQKISGSYNIEKGQAFSIYANDLFQSINPSEIEYASSNLKVATINNEGYINTLQNGTAKITASLKNYPNIKSSFTLKVSTAVEDVVLYKDYYEVYVGEKIPIDYEIIPLDASVKKLNYTIQDRTIASVSNNNIIGKKEGITTITLKVKSNPNIQKQVTVNVLAQRNYKMFDTTDITKSDEYEIEYIDVGEVLKISNDYSNNAIFECTNNSVISYEVTERNIQITGLKRGVAILTIKDGDSQEHKKILVNKYIDDETNKYNVSVSKLVLPKSEKDLEYGLNYINDTILEVGQATSLKFYVSPLDASIQDLQYSISNEKDFSLSENGTIVAINPNKSTNFTISSKTNPNVKATIKITSEIGEVERVEFTRSYTGNAAFDINKSDSYNFNPVFYMKNGSVLDPREHDLSKDQTYKKLLQRVKIKSNDIDIIKIKNNKAYPIEGVNGYGSLEMVFDEGKETELRARTNFEVLGVIIEQIEKISFVKNKYEIDNGGDYVFNLKIITNTGKTYNPQKEGVVSSEEYQKLISQIQIENLNEEGEYQETRSLVRFNSNNSVSVINEGKCKLRFIVPGTDVSAETVLDINFNRNIEKEINDTRYVGAKSAIIVSDMNKPSSTIIEKATKGQKLYAHEKYTNGWVRVTYNDNDKLYIKATNLTLEPPKVDTSTSKVEKNINAKRYIGYDNVELSKPGGSGTISVSKGTEIYALEKYTDGWVRVKYNNNENLYVEATYLTVDLPKEEQSNMFGKVINVQTSLNVRNAPSTSNSEVIGSLANGAEVEIINRSGDWYKITFNGINGYVNASYIQEISSNKQGQTSGNSDLISSILKTADDCVGISYAWGGTSPNVGFDCSGFVQYVFKMNGINISRVSQDQYNNDGVNISRDNLQPGDLIFFDGAGHVGIYVGNNQYIHAPGTGKKVKYTTFYSGMNYYGAKRLV